MIRVDLITDIPPMDCLTVEKIEQWVRAALAGKLTHATVAVRLCDETQMQTLNATHRQKNYPTNVLSFPSQLPKPFRGDFLGDLALCPAVIQREATAQGKTLVSHFAHLVIHGTLHLLGFDHEHSKDAEKMEKEERSIMQTLGFPDPYHDEFTHD